MRKTTLAYLAGCIDSDGSFTVRVDKTEERNKKNRSARHHEMISLKQVTPQVPTLLHESFGGCLYLQGPSVTKGRPLWSWHVSAMKAASAIRVLLPYLLIKREQALLLLELRATKDKFKRRRNVGSFTRTTTEELEKREAIRLKMRMLNHVGV